MALGRSAEIVSCETLPAAGSRMEVLLQLYAIEMIMNGEAHICPYVPKKLILILDRRDGCDN